MARKSRKSKRGGGIKSVSFGGRRVQVGSKAYSRYLSSGQRPDSGSGKNLYSRDIRDIQGDFPEFSQEIEGLREQNDRLAQQLGDFQADQKKALEEQKLGQTALGQAQGSETNQPGINQQLLDQEQNIYNQARTLAPTLSGQDRTRLSSALGGLGSSMARYRSAFRAGPPQGLDLNNAGQARGAVGAMLPPPIEANPLDPLIQGDPFMEQLMTSWQEMMAPQKQKDSLTKEYQKLLRQSGLEELDTQLMDAKKVIEGTEDDIRNEVTKMGGFATESQVQALTNARNKSLIQNYNNLLELRAQKEERFNTMLQLAQADRAEADRRFDRMFSIGTQIMQYRDRMQDNAINQFQWLASRPGGLQAIQAGISQNPAYYQPLVDKVLGGVGGLAALASAAPAADTQVVDIGGNKVLINSQTGQTIRNLGGGGDISGSLADLDFGAPDYFTNLMESTRGRKAPNQVETLRPIQKSIAVINQLEGLQQSIGNTVTDPILGTLRKFNPYDFDARAIQAQLQALVPNLARGVYGEVGVLTDQDIKNYIQTLPNIKGTKAQNEFVTGMTLRTVQRNLESQLETLASAGYDISGFRNQYQKVLDTVRSMENRLGIGGGTEVPKSQSDIFNEIVSQPSGYWSRLWSAIRGR